MLRKGLDLTLEGTTFDALGDLQAGKVRDSYRWPNQRRAIVVTDRVSVYDRVIGTVPFKGQILNGITNYWFEATADICQNHLIEAVDPAASVVAECEPFAAEFVVRGFLTGSSATSLWTLYAAGNRAPYGYALPPGLAEHSRLDEPLLTPTTKAAAGEHDTPVTIAELKTRGILSALELDQVVEKSLALFARGQAIAAARGLILVDTKYEFGRARDGSVMLIDEIHTPDSSRYWIAASYEEALEKGEVPAGVDKDYLRRHMRDRGFVGDGVPPPLDDETRIEATRRYITLFEQITGQEFVPEMSDPLSRIEAALRRAFAGEGR